MMVRPSRRPINGELLVDVLVDRAAAAAALSTWADRYVAHVTASCGPSAPGELSRDPERRRRQLAPFARWWQRLPYLGSTWHLSVARDADTWCGRWLAWPSDYSGRRLIRSDAFDAPPAGRLCQRCSALLTRAQLDYLAARSPSDE